MSTAVIVSVIGAITSISSALFATWVGRKRQKVEVRSIESDIYDRLINTIREENALMVREIAYLRRAVYALEILVRQHGGDPSPIVQLLDDSRAKL